MEKQKFHENKRIIYLWVRPNEFSLRFFYELQDPTVGRKCVSNQIEILVNHILHSIPLISHFKQPCYNTL